MSVRTVNQTTGELDSVVAGSTLYADAPVGSIQAYGGATAPFGWLLCQGQAVSRATYAELFGVIGTSFGAGDGSTTFNVPDLRETVPVGSDTRGSGVSAHDTYTVGQFKDDQMQNAEGHFTAYSYSDGLAGGAFSSNIDNPDVLMGGTTPTLNFDDFSFNLSNVARTGTTTHGKQLGVNFIIKVTNTALPTDFANAVDEKIDDITSIEYNSATLVTQSNYTFAKCQYTKSGHLCTAFIQLNVITNAMSEINCASGFPRSAQDGANAHFWAFRWDNFNADPVGMYINQNGNLLVKGGISGGSSPYVVAFTYITKD